MYLAAQLQYVQLLYPVVALSQVLVIYERRLRVESKKNEKNTENVTGNRPNMDRKRCSERSTDDGDLEKKDEENVIIETTKVQCLESRMQTDIIATTHLTPRFFQPIQPSWPLRRGAETRPCG